MAEVIRCDRCGKIIDKPEWIHKTFQNSDVNNTYRELDICDECHESYEKWLKQETPYIDTDILVRLKKDLEHKSKLADKRKEEIDKLKRRLNAIYGTEDKIEVITLLNTLKDQADKYDFKKYDYPPCCPLEENAYVRNTIIRDTKLDSFNFVIDKAIDILKGDTEDALR